LLSGTRVSRNGIFNPDSKQFFTGNEINMTDYEKAKQQAVDACAAADIASQALQQFPKGPMGLTPDSVRRTAEFQSAKSAFDKCFAAERAANTYLLKHFPTEVRADRAQQSGRRIAKALMRKA
jgi:response regulator of citrate/malate metabolism